MRLENILALTHATLINDPFVRSFENIVLDASKVKRGDLFIAFDENSISEALLNGAYGVVFDKPTQINDHEIAWIKTPSLQDSLVRLLRFKLLEKDIIVYECNEIILKLALQVITQSDFIVLYGSIKDIAKSLLYAEEKSTVLFCPALCDKNIFTNIKALPKTAIEPIIVMEQTLFETSFIYENVFYERQTLSPFFIPYLEELLHLFKTANINYRLKKFTPIEHFEAVFTNKNFEIKEFGTSDKVLIFESNADLIDSEVAFLKKQANWAKSIFIFPHAHKKECEANEFNYLNESEILPILRSNNFHFALIAGVTKKVLNSPISLRATQLTLDF